MGGSQSTLYVVVPHGHYKCMYPRENEGTERDIEGVDQDMSIPLKLFIVLDGKGSLFSETSASRPTSI